MKTIFKYAAAFLIGAASINTYGQDQAQPVDSLYDLSLEDLMNIKIQSASKKEETLFDAPLSSYTITKADIDKAGSTSIMEALRMAPGVIVREQTNGIYDIHIRGFDNIQRTSADFNKANLMTLVMIDNRPVFNNNLGGTFWESLPIDIQDVERIEIVRGPSAPLFGPNAVSGVINIITHKLNSEKATVNASVQGGTPSTLIANVGLGKKSGKWSFQASANHQQRDRFDSEYYQSSTGTFVAGNLVTSDFAKRYPNSGQSMNKTGVNGFIGFAPSEKVSIDLSVGTQNSQVQKNFIDDNGTKFTTNETQSWYANLAAKVGGLSVRSSFGDGTENLSKANRPNQYDFQVAGVDAEYAIKAGDNVTITPGFSYQYVKFTDDGYTNEDTNTTAGYLNGTQSINTAAAFLRTDLNITKNWRVLAAGRADKFSTPDKTYLAYEFASTYKINSKNLIRVAITRSNSGSFVGYNYLNVIVPTPVPGLSVTQSGNTNLKLLTINMIEVGYRAQLSKQVQIDVDLFNQQAKNFSAIIAQEFSPIINAVSAYAFVNLPTTAVQNGATLGINFVPNDKLQVKPFITIQKTETRKLPSSYADASLDPTLTYSTSTHKNTPSFYGGYYINYKASKKFNLNLNGYYFAGHRQYDQSDLASTSTVGDIKGKLLVNVKANWNVNSKLSLFVNGRNALNNTSREFFGTDHIRGLYMVGASFSLH